MRSNRTCSALAIAVVCAALAAPAGAQVVAQAARAEPAKLEAVPLTLGDLARAAREVEAEKQRRALREAKGEAATAQAAGTHVASPVEAPARRKKEAKKAPAPDGLFVRAIYGVAPATYVRFFTRKNEFEDRLVGEVIDGWKVVRIHDGVVTLQKGGALYPMALQMRTAASLESPPAVPVSSTVPLISAGQLPDPRVGK